MGANSQERQDEGQEPTSGTTRSPPATDTASHRSRPPSESSDVPPPLPPRPNTLNLLDEGANSPGTVRQTAQPNLQGKATTAVSLTDIGFQQSQDGGKDTHATHISLPSSLRARASLSQLTSSRGSETGDSASIRSSIPNAEPGEVENVFNDFAAESGVTHQDSSGLLQFPEFQADDVEDDFASEFEPVGEVTEGGENEGLY